MFIPTWLLVVVVVLILFAFGRALLEAIAGVAIMAGVLLVIGSIVLSLYFFSQRENELALLVGVPWIVVALWGLLISARQVWDETGQLKVGTLRTFMALHEARVKYLHASPAGMVNARVAFANRLRLGETLFKFYEDVRHFPSWYANAINQDGSRWSSDVIPADTVSNVPAHELKSSGIPLPDGASVREWFVYRFSAGRSAYAFCVHSDTAPSWEDDWRSSAYRAYVVELPDTVVLEIKLVFVTGEYADSFRSDYIESFRPGPWLVDLFRAAGLVRAESEAKHKAFTERFEADRAKKFS